HIPMRRLVKHLFARIIARVTGRAVEDTAFRRPDLVEALADKAAMKAVEKVFAMASLEKTLTSASGKTPYELFRDVRSDLWLWLTTQGYRASSPLRAILPGLPDERLQLEAVALKGDDALKQGFSVYALFKRIYEENKGSLAGCEAVLDFGCGWGRVLRFF